MPAETLADTLIGRILANVQAAVQTITVANGYHVTFKAASVTLEEINPFNVAETELPLAIITLSNPNRRNWHPAMEIQDFIRVLITIRAMASGNVADATRKIALGLNIHADLEKALTVDITRGGLCGDTRLDPPDAPIPGMGSDNQVVVVQELECRYLRQYGQP